jgi:SAM-dependent methyltransferase
VWCVKGGRRGDATVNDALMEAPIPYLVERLTVKGEVILDPLCGTGEVLAAAHGLGRALIGMDPDPANVAMAQRRLAVSAPDSSRS